MINACIFMATLLYAGQTLFYYWNGNTAQALVMVGYIVANVGLMWSVK